MKGLIALKNKNLLFAVLIIGIIATLIYFGFVGKASVNFGDPSTYLKDSDLIKYQYSGQVPLWQETCAPWDISIGGISFEEIKVVATAKSVFRFVVKNVDNVYCQGYPTNNIRYDVEVYKENVLIDTIHGISQDLDYASCTPSPIWRGQEFYRSYSDTGKVYIPEGDEITPILYSRNPTSAGYVTGQYSTAYPYFNSVKEIKLPNDESGINAHFKIGGGFDSGGRCHTERSYLINKYEIINIEDQTEIISTTQNQQASQQSQQTSQSTTKISFWDKILNFFKKIGEWFKK